MARFSSLHSVLGAAATLLLLLTLCVVSVEASYWSDEVNRVRTYAAVNYMERIAKQPNVSTLPSGLLFTIERRGFGDRAPAAEDKCEMHYTIRHRYPSILEDTRHHPYPVRRSPSQLMPGMAEAMQLMREGDRWYLYVPYQLAYGKEGCKEKNVPSLSNLRVEIELYKCESASGKTSAEIDAYLAKYMKTPIPEKTAPVDYTDL
ncbi:putative peptidyl-prolyl cis-trans isomerase, macrophage infectivity potentiator precursor [Leishmania mexicana MHOM/GT/2001/U1103]|uniref:peptidylprolyl isomerase n=1 Tax=Leishmania mexicana (strain MHOM/GT/2001/U1103) TaxID=929439 RepID=E9AS47_LEIMU|nr:putative peptidyl-prolyl cis-trans isomerase, macrophage infectivity potentiator precursor [Leishmania mexicana MHOM/GT/2001/U1103]CBZ25768.1 putative peptidyl-prolyl cis-trans isomerase, macrophage infectivity potentiator precursor [Leishmania mexicana MHOM/GT/2001/U1103]